MTRALASLPARRSPPVERIVTRCWISKDMRPGSSIMAVSISRPCAGGAAVSTGICLANPGKEYLIDAPGRAAVHRGPVRRQRELRFSSCWYDAIRGAAEAGDALVGRCQGPRRFSPLFPMTPCSTCGVCGRSSDCLMKSALSGIVYNGHIRLSAPVEATFPVCHGSGNGDVVATEHVPTIVPSRAGMRVILLPDRRWLGSHGLPPWPLR